ncbi:hypothetical protein SD074_30180 [Prolixibacter sp. SD074]|nr:hypothetical protein SD074_30180 [Prolixibacter sp. SD074]
MWARTKPLSGLESANGLQGQQAQQTATGRDDSPAREIRKEVKGPVITQGREAQKEAKGPAGILELKVRKEEEIQNIFQELSAPREAIAPIVSTEMKELTGENIPIEKILAPAAITIAQTIRLTVKTIVFQGKMKSGATAARN